MRRLMIPVSLTLLLGALAACTPPRIPIVGLMVRDGRPVAVLVTCDEAFSSLSVYSNDSNEQTTSQDTSPIDWRVYGTPATEVIEVTLLGPAPDGWDGSSFGLEIEPWTKLSPGVRYHLGGSSFRHAITVSFTTADFDRIGTDEVLAPTGRRRMGVISRDAFLQEARESRDSC